MDSFDAVFTKGTMVCTCNEPFWHLFCDCRNPPQFHTRIIQCTFLFQLNLSLWQHNFSTVVFRQSFAPRMELRGWREIFRANCSFSKLSRINAAWVGLWVCKRWCDNDKNCSFPEASEDLNINLQLLPRINDYYPYNIPCYLNYTFRNPGTVNLG